MRRIVLVVGVAVAALVAVVIAAPAAAGPTDIEGTVFEDRNHNGVRDADEPAVAGISVTATAADGSVSGPVLSGDDGRYVLPTAGEGIHRVDFSIPGALTGFQPAPRPAASTPGEIRTGSAVQFSAANGPVADGDAGVDFGVARSWTYCQAAPTLVSNCYLQGDIEGDVLISVPWAFHAHNDGNPDGGWTGQDTPQAGAPTSLALNSEIGTTFGLAWNPDTSTIYAGAYLKRKAAFGPDGPAAIYQHTGGVTSLFVDLSDHLGANAAGVNPHPLDGTVWIDDEASVSLVGKMGLGDLDVSADGSTLYAVNLHDRTIVAIPLDGTPVSSASIEVFPFPTPDSCEAADLRPFALGVDRIGDGSLHAGAVCSAQSTGEQDDLRMYVWEVSAAGSFSLLLDHPLMPRPGFQHNWVPWSDDVADTLTMGAKRQAMLTDLEFDDVGLLVGLRDRWGDQTPGSGRLPNESPWPRGNGDTVRTCWVDGVLEVESDGSCGPVTNQPAGGEFFFRDAPGDTDIEGMIGGLAIRPGDDVLINTSYDSVAYTDDGTSIVNNFNTAGVTRLDTTDGDYLGAYDFFRNGNGEYFGKASGAGDVELLCDAAPLQIGDRVWFDADDDGLQDPDEPGLAGVVVTLRDADGVALATTTTDAAGTYVFTVSPGVDHRLTFDVGAATGLPSGVTVDDLDLATRDAGADEIDSDARLVDAVPTIEVPARAAGAHDHTLDIGFTVAEARYRVGNLVWLDLDADGLAEAGEPGLAGVLLELRLDDDGVAGPTSADSVVSTTNTAADGTYRFSDLAAGVYHVIVSADQSTATDPAALDGLVSSRTGEESDPDADVDNNDNGTLPTPIGIGSGAVTLGGDAEPTDEVSRLGSGTDDDADEFADDRSNLTVDFGFHALAALGDRVWFDEDRDGVQGSGEPGVAGVTVRLHDDPDAPPLDSTVTDTSGSYGFDGLLPGTYTVCFELSFGAGSEIGGATVSLVDLAAPVITRRGVGADPAADSNVSVSTGCSAPVTLGPGDVDPTIDAGVHVEVVDLTISKTVDDDATASGATWHIEVTNLGLDAEPGPVTVVDEFPVGVTPLAATGDGWACTIVTRTVTCELGGGLAAGVTSAPISITSTIGAEAIVPVVNEARVLEVLRESDPDNNRDDASFVPPAEVLSNSAEPDPDTGVAGAGGLPATGSETGRTLLVAIGLILSGVVMMVLTLPRLRRR